MATDQQRVDVLLDELGRYRAVLWAAQVVLLDVFSLLDDLDDLDPVLRPDFGDRGALVRSDVKHFLETVPWVPTPAAMPDCYRGVVSASEPCS